MLIFVCDMILQTSSSGLFDGNKRALPPGRSGTLCRPTRGRRPTFAGLRAAAAPRRTTCPQNARPPLWCPFSRGGYFSNTIPLRPSWRHAFEKRNGYWKTIRPEINFECFFFYFFFMPNSRAVPFGRANPKNALKTFFA